jgi:anti-sigma B factor antagonist
VRHSYYMRETVAPDGTYQLLFAGDLDLHSTGQLDAAIDKTIEKGARRVELDLSETKFIDSTAIGSLLRAYGRLGAAGIGLQITCDEPNVLRIFDLCHIDELLPIKRPDRGLTTVV